MAIRFPTVNDRLRRTTGLPDTTQHFTLDFQGADLAPALDDVAQYKLFLTLFTGGMEDYSTPYLGVFTYFDGTDNFIVIEAGPAAVDTDPLVVNVGQWQQGGLALEYNHSTHVITFYVAGVALAGTITYNFAATPFTSMVVGSDGTSSLDQRANSAIERLRAWQALLNSTELILEGARLSAQRLTNLLFDSAFSTSTDTAGWTVIGSPVSTTGPFNGTWFIKSGTSWIGIETDGTPITIQALAGGGAGGHVVDGSPDFTAPGGGGAAFATDRVPYASGSPVTGIQIGAGGVGATGNGTSTDGTDTIWNSGVVVAKAGKKGNAATGAAGQGGQADDCTPPEGAFSGGDGGPGQSSSTQQSGSGGGGAAGPFGDGKDGGLGGGHPLYSGAGGGGNGGGSATDGEPAGAGDGAAGGVSQDGTPGGEGGLAAPTIDDTPTPGAPGVNGSGGGGGGGLDSQLTAHHGQPGGQGGAGIDLDPWHGSGGGGGGSGANSNLGGISEPGGDGGLYGGGGAGGGWEYSGANSGAGGDGAPGLIVVNYTPPPIPGPPPVETPRLIRRMRRFALPFDRQFWMYVSRIEFTIQPGVGNTNPPGASPEIEVRFSGNGGKTWGDIITVDAGEIGEFFARPVINRIGKLRNGYCEIAVSDPVLWAFMEATIDAEESTG